VTIGERIKNRRISLGLTVEQLAARLNKNRATIYRYESDEIENMSISVLEPLAKVLHCSPAYLMGWEDDEGNDLKTIAAHAIEDLNEEQLKDIIKYAKFIKSQE